MTTRKPWACAACHQSDTPRYHPRAIICELCRDSAAARGLAWCTRGRHRVSADAMSPSTTCCRACNAARNRKYPDKRVGKPSGRRSISPEARRAYYLRNRDRILAAARRHREAHREQLAAAQRAYHAAHREAENARKRAWRIRAKLRVLRGWRRAA